MTPALVTLGLGAWLAGVAALAVIEACAARSRARNYGELAFHRHELRAIEGRFAARERGIAAQVASLDALLARPRPCGGSGPAEPADATTPAWVDEPCAAQPARCVMPARAARLPDGRPDEVRRAVFRAVAADPRSLGPILYLSDPRVPWEPTVRALPGHDRRPVPFVTHWGHA